MDRFQPARRVCAQFLHSSHSCKRHRTDCTMRVGAVYTEESPKDSATEMSVFKMPHLRPLHRSFCSALCSWCGAVLRPLCPKRTVCECKPPETSTSARSVAVDVSEQNNLAIRYTSLYQTAKYYLSVAIRTAHGAGRRVQSPCREVSCALLCCCDYAILCNLGCSTVRTSVWAQSPGLQRLFGT